MDSNPLLRLSQMPTLAARDAAFDSAESSGRGDIPHFPEDDLIHPPVLGILEREIQRVPKGTRHPGALVRRRLAFMGRRLWPHYGRSVSWNCCAPAVHRLGRVLFNGLDWKCHAFILVSSG
jgi:hypothetical protein